MTVVITPDRVFAFGNHDLALRFERRARRLPSMRGQTIEVVRANVFKGRKVPPPVRPMAYASETPWGAWERS